MRVPGIDKMRIDNHEKSDQSRPFHEVQRWALEQGDKLGKLNEGTGLAYGVLGAAIGHLYCAGADADTLAEYVRRTMAAHAALDGGGRRCE